MLFVRGKIPTSNLCPFCSSCSCTDVRGHAVRLTRRSSKTNLQWRRVSGSAPWQQDAIIPAAVEADVERIWNSSGTILSEINETRGGCVHVESCRTQVTKQKHLNSSSNDICRPPYTKHDLHGVPRDLEEQLACALQTTFSVNRPSTHNCGQSVHMGHQSNVSIFEVHALMPKPSRPTLSTLHKPS